MRKIYFVLFFVSFIFISCNKNNKINNSNLENQEVANLIQGEVKLDLEEIKNTDNSLETEIEQALKTFTPAIELVSEYDFEPVSDFDLKLMDFSRNDDNCIICSYDKKTLCLITDVSESSDSISNNCIPFREDRLSSASFTTKVNDNYYYGVINLPKGLLKLYKSLQTDHQFSIPYYSGKDSFFIINNVRIVKPSFYDYKTFCNVDAIYGGYIEVYNFFTNEIVYRIDKRELHKNTKYDIDKINYDEDGFRVVIGNYFDSDEYTDFKIFTNENNFHYEIYDTYSYSDFVQEDDDFYDE